jgi:acetylornithine deacetylase/succinyl-diaminopimelate desuccinylase-like protein
MRRLIFGLFAVTVVAGVVAAIAAAAVLAQTPAQPDWAAIEDETMRHFQTLVRADTQSPPGNEKPAADYLVQVLQREGIPVQTFALEAHRPNVVARLTGSGRKRPLLIMGHTDTVNVDPKKWTHPPFGATRDGGYVYGRGTLDDKDTVTAGLMVMLMLKRGNVALDRDVIFLAESGEEGDARVGIGFMVEQHYSEIDAEYCYAETGEVNREGGRVRYATVQTVEKLPRGIDLIARGPAGHGSVPLKTNAVVHLSTAVAKVAAWKPAINVNDTTGTYFKRLAAISTPEAAKRYRDVLSLDPKISGPADDYLLEYEPRHASMLRSSLTPTMFQAGYRINVIPSEATATLDVRVMPDENLDRFLEQVRKVVDDPTVEVKWANRTTRPAGTSPLNTEAYNVIEAAITKHYATTTLPTMSTGATDMAFLRAKGMQCYGVGPAIDAEDGPKGFGSHSDQERILESELHRYVRFYWEIATNLARAGAGVPAAR